MTTSSRVLQSHGEEFIVTVSIEEAPPIEGVCSDQELGSASTTRLLVVDATNTSTSERWRGSFAPSYVEEMTHRAGNFKEFAIFARMLGSAIRGDSECLRVDLLTYSDLQRLSQSRRGTDGDASSSASVASKARRRYLIVTYSAEFDSVSYPLPLAFEEPTVALLQAVVRRLQAQLQELYRRSERSKGLEEQAGRAEGLEREVSRLKEAVAALTRENEELRDVGGATAKLQEELGRVRSELAEAVKRVDGAEESRGDEAAAEIAALRDQVRKMEGTFAEERMALVAELEESRANEKRLGEEVDRLRARGIAAARASARHVVATSIASHPRRGTASTAAASPPKRTSTFSRSYRPSPSRFAGSVSPAKPAGRRSSSSGPAQRRLSREAEEKFSRLSSGDSAIPRRLSRSRSPSPVSVPPVAPTLRRRSMSADKSDDQARPRAIRSSRGSATPPVQGVAHRSRVNCYTPVSMRKPPIPAVALSHREPSLGSSRSSFDASFGIDEIEEKRLPRQRHTSASRRTPERASEDRGSRESRGGDDGDDDDDDGTVLPEHLAKSLDTLRHFLESRRKKRPL